MLSGYLEDLFSSYPDILLSGYPAILLYRQSPLCGDFAAQSNKTLFAKSYECSVSAIEGGASRRPPKIHPFVFPIRKRSDHVAHVFLLVHTFL